MKKPTKEWDHCRICTYCAPVDEYKHTCAGMIAIYTIVAVVIIGVIAVIL